MSEDSGLQPRFLATAGLMDSASIGTMPQYLAQHYPHTYDAFRDAV